MSCSLFYSSVNTSNFLDILKLGLPSSGDFFLSLSSCKLLSFKSLFKTLVISVVLKFFIEGNDSLPSSNKLNFKLISFLELSLFKSACEVVLVLGAFFSMLNFNVMFEWAGLIWFILAFPFSLLRLNSDLLLKAVWVPSRSFRTFFPEFPLLFSLRSLASREAFKKLSLLLFSIESFTMLSISFWLSIKLYLY